MTDTFPAEDHIQTPHEGPSEDIHTVTMRGGLWGVVDNGLFIPCTNNATAWTLADKLNLSPLNRQEAVHDWSAGKVD